MADDPVASAATDGARLTSAKRDSFLNNGIRVWIEKVYQSKQLEPLNAYIQESTVSLSSGKYALSSFSPACAFILGVRTSTQHIEFVPETLYNIAILGVDKYYTVGASHYLWTWNNAQLQVAGASSDSVTVRYIQRHTDLSANGATDIAIQSPYWEEIIREAFKIYCLEDPTQENLIKLQALNGK